jgi:APA family basic amino acid/polyamine antiporter
MIESQRDAGLVRAIGTRGLSASIVNAVVGAGIFAVPGPLAACLGPYGPLAYVICGIAVGAVAICWAEGGSRVPTSGGAYGYIDAAFGPHAGFVAGMLLLVSDMLACGGITAAVADVVANLLPVPLQAPVHAVVIIAVIGGFGLINLGGVALGAKLVDWAAAVKLIPLFVFVLAGATAMHFANFKPTVVPSTQGLGRALILVLFVLTGMEVSLNASGEVAQPSRTIPRALGIGLMTVTLLYIAIQVTAQGILGASLANSSAALPDAMARISPALRLLMLAGVAISSFGWVSSDLLGSPRILFAFARDGMMPRLLGRVHPRTHAPYMAILTYAAVAIVLALTGSFAELAVLATLGSALLYAAGSVAAWVLNREGVAQAGTPLNFRWLTTAMITATGSMLVVIMLAARAEILGLIGVIVVSSAIYLVRSRAAEPA